MARMPEESHLIVFAISQNYITNLKVSANRWVSAYHWLANIVNFVTSNNLNER